MSVCVNQLCVRNLLKERVSRDFWLKVFHGSINDTGGKGTASVADTIGLFTARVIVTSDIFTAGDTAIRVDSKKDVTTSAVDSGGKFGRCQ